MFKYKVNKEDYDKLDEAIQAFYKEDGDNYILQVEGAVDKTKLGEFRDNNTDLLKQLDKFKDVDLNEVNELKEQKRKLRDKELIDSKDFDTLINERTNALKTDSDAKIANLQSELEASQSQFTSLVSKHEIEGAAQTSFAKHKISPDATTALLSQIKSKFSVQNKAVVAMDGDNIELGANGNLTIDEFVGSQPEIFKIQSSGGNGNGSTGGQPNAQKSSRDRISSGIKTLLKA